MNNGTTPRGNTLLDQALLEAAREVLNQARSAMAEPGLQTNVAVHEFRKSVKQWRAWLRLFEPYLGEGPRNLRALARDTSRRLGSARDLRSALDALNDLRTSAPDLSERSQIAIRESLEEMQSAAESHEIGSEQRAAIASEAGKWLEIVSLWPFSRIAKPDLLDAVSEGYRRARRAIPKDWRNADEEDLHEVRRRTIDHRYQLELIRTLTGRRGKLAIDEAQSLREAIGRHRDLTLLMRLAGPHQPLARFRSKLAPAIARRQKEHLREAARIAESLYAKKPRTFRAVIEKHWDPNRAST